MDWADVTGDYSIFTILVIDFPFSWTGLIALYREMRSAVRSHFEDITDIKPGRQHGDILVSENLNWAVRKPSVQMIQSNLHSGGMDQTRS